MRAESTTGYNSVMSTRKKRRPGFVYLATGPDGHKIGVTTDLTNRLWQHHSDECPSVAIVWSLWVEPDALAVELGLHRRFAAKRVRGEWFALAPEDVTLVTSLDAAGAAVVAAGWEPTRPRTGERVRPETVFRKARAHGSRRDLTGEAFGLLTAVRCVGSGGTNGGAVWEFRCGCGAVKNIPAVNVTRTRRPARTCGAVVHVKASRHRTHGRTNTPEYSVWRSVVARCTKPTDRRFKNYGGRGITVCDRWLKFENFLADMGQRPAPGLSVERKNNDGPYSPENCVWATAAEQVANRRNTHRLTLNGVTKTLAEWAREIGLPWRTLHGRIFDYHWTVERALTTPARGWSPGKPRRC